MEFLKIDKKYFRRCLKGNLFANCEPLIITKSKRKIKTRIYAKIDPIFKMIFGDPENKTALIGLLSEIIDIPEEEYSHIEIIDPNLRIDKLDSKSGILDIKLTTKNEQKINIELQVRKVSDLKQRILSYASKMISEQFREGQKYDRIQKSYKHNDMH